MKKGIGAILGLIMVVSLVSCGNVNNADKNVSNNTSIKKDVAEQKPEDAITDLFTKFKNCNFKAVKEDLLTEDSIGFEDFEDYSQEEQKAIKYWLQKLSYEVINTKVNEDEAVVNTKVSALDGNQIYDKFKENVSNLTGDTVEEFDEKDEIVANKEYEEAFINAIKDKNNEIVSTNVDIKLEKKDGKWLIDLNKELLTAMYGGLDPEKVEGK